MSNDFITYITEFEKNLKRLFHNSFDINKLSLERGMPSSLLKEIMSNNPLSVAIPEKFGGRGVNVKECLSVLSSASYESLPLSLTFGINIALFLEPIAKYANDKVKNGIFQRFMKNQNMGGLMITEPNYGSDALNMQTNYEKVGNEYRIKGIKHWQGLTGMADYWLIASREKTAFGNLGRDINFFICDVTEEKQQIEVSEYYNNLGLYMIPYGKNIIDIKVPNTYKLEPETSGIKMMLDILHRSRMQFPGMAMGFIKRMLNESLEHCKKRIIGERRLIDFDQVQYQISRIQSAYTIASAMCFRSSKISGIENDLSNKGIEANTMKAFVTDLMQESAQNATQLFGSTGYKMENIAGRGILDSRSFQIFEGSNEMLYTQIAEMISKMMRRKKEFNIYKFLKDYELTLKSYDYFKCDLDFIFSPKIAQRKLIDFGKIISRVISFDFVLDIENSGFRKDLVSNCLEILKLDVSRLVTTFSQNNKVKQIEEYTENSYWYDFV